MWFYGILGEILWVWLFWPLLAVVLLSDGIWILRGVHKAHEYRRGKTDDNPIGALAFALFIFALALHLFGLVDLVTPILKMPKVGLRWAIYFAIAGLIYVIPTFARRVRLERGEAIERGRAEKEAWFNSRKDDWLEQKVPGIPGMRGGTRHEGAASRQEFLEKHQQEWEAEAEKLKPEWEKHKAKLDYLKPPSAKKYFGWMVFTWLIWPFDLVVAFFFDWIDAFVRQAAEWCKTALQRAINRLWAGASDEVG